MLKLRQNLFMLCLCGVAASAQAQESAASKGYSLKQEDSSIGSHILRKEVTGIQLPVDKTYAELTPEEKNIVRSQYVDMPEHDEPPYPAHGTRAIYQALAQGQNVLAVQGRLSMYVEIDSSGHAVSVGVFESPDEKMTQYAARVLMQETFKPGICNGTPCKMQFPFRMNFKKGI